MLISTLFCSTLVDKVEKSVPCCLIQSLIVLIESGLNPFRSSALSENVEQNKESIATLTNDINKLQKDLEDLNKISIWQEFVVDSDMPPVTEATKIIDTKESLDSLENTENEDIAVTSNDAMEYFNNVAAKTFKNITL